MITFCFLSVSSFPIGLVLSFLIIFFVFLKSHRNLFVPQQIFSPVFVLSKKHKKQIKYFLLHKNLVSQKHSQFSWSKNLFVNKTISKWYRKVGVVFRSQIFSTQTHTNSQWSRFFFERKQQIYGQETFLPFFFSCTKTLHNRIDGACLMIWVDWDLFQLWL